MKIEGRFAIEGFHAINQMYSLSLEENSFLAYSEPQQNVFYTIEDNKSIKRSKFEDQQRVTKHDSVVQREKRGAITYMEIDSKNSQRLFVGYKDGSAEIFHSDTLESLFTTDTTTLTTDTRD